MSKFHIGDKVRILDGSMIEEYAGGWHNETMAKYIGTVHTISKAAIYFSSERVGYMMEDIPLVFDKRGLELVKQEAVSQKIVIVTDGKVTTAKLYDGKQVVKTATAICSSEDNFNFNYGASLALDRLTGFIRGNIECKLDTTLDWKKFASGKLQVKVNKEKFKDFLKKCEEHNLNWSDDTRATEFDVYEDYDKLPSTAKMMGAILGIAPKNVTWLCVKDGNLRFNFEAEEDVEEYEFV